MPACMAASGQACGFAALRKAAISLALTYHFALAASTLAWSLAFAAARMSAAPLGVALFVFGTVDRLEYDVTVVTISLEPVAAPLRRWLLLLYKVSPQPTARRVYVWRKLKRLGAVLLHDAVWVLPDTTRTREHFQWLAAEIIEMGGEALVWESQLVQGTTEQALIQKFAESSEAAYRALLKDLKKKEPDLAALSQQYQQVKQKDYFQSSLAAQVRASLTSARGGEGQ